MSKKTEQDTDLDVRRPESQNESTPAEQRAPRRNTVGRGPKVHEDTGAFLPGAYKTSRGNVREDR